MTTPTPITQQIVRYDVSEADIRATEERYAALTCDTPQGYEAVRHAIAEIRGTRTSIETRRKDLKAESLNYGRRVDAVARALTDMLLAIEEPLKAKKAVIDDEKMRLIQEAEAERVRAFEEVRRAEREAQEAIEREAREAEAAELRRQEMELDRKSTRLNSSHIQKSRMPSSA